MTAYCLSILFPSPVASTCPCWLDHAFPPCLASSEPGFPFSSPVSPYHHLFPAPSQTTSNSPPLSPPPPQIKLPPNHDLITCCHMPRDLRWYNPRSPIGHPYLVGCVHVPRRRWIDKTQSQPNQLHDGETGIGNRDA